MSMSYGLITTPAEYEEFFSTLAAKSHGVLAASGLTCTLAGTSDVQIVGTYSSDGNVPFKNAEIHIHEASSGNDFPIVGGNTSDPSLAWQILSFASGDVIVKLSQWHTNCKLDIWPESFQSWGIAAYSLGTHTRRTGRNDLLCGCDYGGFMTHFLEDGGAAISVFDYTTKAPLFTWTALATEKSDSLCNRDGFKSYTEKNRIYRGLMDQSVGYRLCCQEPYDTPKRTESKYAVLAPVVGPSTCLSPAKRAKWLMQSPYLYNPFDGTQYFSIDGVFYYSDFGVCACAEGESLSITGASFPEHELYRPVTIGDNALDGSGNPSGYAIYDIEF